MQTQRLHVGTHRPSAFTGTCPGHHHSAHRRCVVARSGNLGTNLLGDLGARDPTAGETETNFGDKILFNASTEHIIKPPDAMGKILGLNARECRPVAELAVLNSDDLIRLRNQVPGWRFNDTGAPSALEQSWKLKDVPSAETFLGMIKEITSTAGHEGIIQADGENVSITLTTTALGGLTENDFIIANRINALQLGDLLPKRKQRFWA